MSVEVLMSIMNYFRFISLLFSLENKRARKRIPDRTRVPIDLGFNLDIDGMESTGQLDMRPSSSNISTKLKTKRLTLGGPTPTISKADQCVLSTCLSRYLYL